VLERSFSEFMGTTHLTNPPLYALWPSLLSVMSLLFVPVSLVDLILAMGVLSTSTASSS
jgi:hypothetical protein